MSMSQKNNKILSLFISLVAFFIFVFFTTNVYSELQVNLDSNNTKTKELEKAREKLVRLNKIETNYNDKSNIVSKKIKKFASDFSEDKMILYINDHIKSQNLKKKNDLFLENISFSDIKKSELGFKEIDINLKIKVSSQESLLSLLNYLTNSEKEYSFFITKLSFPIEKSWPYQMSIPLKMYVN